MPVTRSTPNRGGQGTTQSDNAQAEQIQPANNTAQVWELTPAKAGTVQPSMSGTQPNDPMAQMLLMMQKTSNEQLKFQREQQKHQDSVTTIRKGPWNWLDS